MNEKEATLGAGCFWCVEAIFRELNGVLAVEPGYAGGHVQAPSYQQVCSGTTGHAEVVRVRYDADLIGFEDLLEVFWRTHDPTTRNRQGNDVGTQYRSAVLFHDEEQRSIAEKALKALDASGAYPRPIVTTIEPLKNYHPAEEEHRDYYVKHPDKGYCSYVIRPKMEKFRAAFADKLK